MSWRFSIFMLVALVAPCLADDPIAKDAKALEGEWKIVAAEIEGEAVPAEFFKTLRWTFKGNEVWEHQANGPGKGKSSFKIDPSKTPKEITMVALDGAEKGKMTEGIYSVDGDKLKLCMRTSPAADKGRPKKFMTEPGSGLGLITMQRVKK